MKKQYEEDYANMGLIALKRASRKVLEKACYDNLRVPIWKNGKIEYISKEINTEQGAEADRQPAAP